MSKEFLPFSWLKLTVPKVNQEYERLKDAHPAMLSGGTSKIPPTPFFTTVADTVVELTCYLANGDFVS